VWTCASVCVYLCVGVKQIHTLCNTSKHMAKCTYTEPMGEKDGIDGKVWRWDLSITISPFSSRPKCGALWSDDAQIKDTTRPPSQLWRPHPQLNMIGLIAAQRSCWGEPTWGGVVRHNKPSLCWGGRLNLELSVQPSLSSSSALTGNQRRVAPVGPLGHTATEGEAAAGLSLALKTLTQT